jgi:hypothetical protein
VYVSYLSHNAVVHAQLDFSYSSGFEIVTYNCRCQH